MWIENEISSMSQGKLAPCVYDIRSYRAECHMVLYGWVT